MDFASTPNFSIVRFNSYEFISRDSNLSNAVWIAYFGSSETTKTGNSKLGGKEYMWQMVNRGYVFVINDVDITFVMARLFRIVKVFWGGKTAAITKVLADEGKAKAIAFDEIDKSGEKKRGTTIGTAYVEYETAKRHYALSIVQHTMLKI
nr:elongation factor Tu, mitochondrial-like [Tanacetum cinerariifolium]